MTKITSKELTALEDQLNYESILVKKFTAVSEQCEDKNLKAKCKTIAQKHQQHYDTLMGYLQ